MLFRRQENLVYIQSTHTRTSTPLPIEATLKARAAERLAEEKLRREDILAIERPPSAQSVEAADRDEPASSPTSPKSVDDGGTVVTQKQLDEKLEKLEDRLNNLEAGCKCAIA